MNSEMATALMLEKLVRDTYSDKRSSAIQPLQWSILRYLKDAEEDNRDIKSIAGSIGVTVAPVSRAVSTLELRGLVKKRDHPQSKKSILVDVSVEGLDALRNDDPILKIAERIENLSKSERKNLEDLLTQLTPMKEKS